MKLLDQILDFLADGKPHSFVELDKQTGLGKLCFEHAVEVLAFLHRYGFIQLRKDTAQISKPTQLFIRRVRWLELLDSKQQSRR